MATRDKDSYIFRQGVTPNTMSVISSKNKIFAMNANGDNIQVGVISTFDPSETRTITPVRGIGFGDHIAELVPGITDPMTISLNRTALYTSNIYQVLGYKAGIDGIVRSLRHHRWPFDIRQEVIFSRLAMTGSSDESNLTGSLDTPNVKNLNEGEDVSALVTIYVACWISNYSTSYSADNAIIQETVQISVTDIMNGVDFTQYTNEPVMDHLSGNGQGRSSLLMPE